MTWLEQWRALAARIDGLIRAGEFLTSAFKVNSADVFSVVRKSFFPELTAIAIEIEQLGKVYEKDLPQKALEALKKYIAQDWQGAAENKGVVALQVFAPLAAFRSEFEYLIRDSEVEGRSLVELAFEHLRRQLVVDKEVQKRWQRAFEENETACERLGAVHLLSHGIWAFKVVAPGGATDLVFGDPLEPRSQLVRRTARALVLTEWKLVKNPGEVVTKAQAGRNQAAIYSGGILGDTELKRTRYVVLVCEADLVPLDDVTSGVVTYRHVVLPISPSFPSVTARRRRIREGS